MARSEFGRLLRWPQPYASGDNQRDNKNMAECDRIVITLHHFQTSIGSKVTYR
jgi:hypothetical protein